MAAISVMVFWVINAIYGVLYLGCTLAKKCGNNPSPAIAYGIRAEVKIPASSDPDIENRAPTAKISAPIDPNNKYPARASGADAAERFIQGTVPNTTKLVIT